MDEGVEIGRDRVYRKVAWRVMPFLLLCYVANYIDRTNIGIAQIHLRTALGFTDEVYGIGVGLFFVGFILFEVPSNILLDRIGARRTLLRIMVAWGVVSTATMFVRTPAEFYGARILLGMAEAGFFPGALLYLTYWFPSARRTRMTAVFFLGLPLSGIIGSPLSGWIMARFGGQYGLAAWQWLFLLEGLPSVLLGIAAFFVLDDRPEKAGWLSPAEKRLIAADLAGEQSVKASGGHRAFLAALRDPRVYVLGLVGCGTYTLANAVGFWSPLIINASGVKEILDVGLLAGIPPLVGVVIMLLVGWSSDRMLERRWHAACSEFAAAASLIALSLYYTNPLVTIALLAVMTAGHYSGLSVFWSVPSVYLSDRAAAGGIAMVTAMGSVAAALTPALLGWIKTHTGALSLGLQVSAGIIVFGGLVLVLGIPARILRERA
ncbi:MAG: MFS transporter [Alphaproteobacteria bacterium]|nr:MFS transporter [Alphaproteobacteria bacterium]